MSDAAFLQHLEAVAADVMQAFEVKAPPVPVESMLQRPREGMWEEVDVSQLSGSFLTVKDYYSPRMSLARLLARHIIWSAWGKAHELGDIGRDEEMIRTFARMLVMPASMVNPLSAAAKNPTAMSMHFEVPEDDARLRLKELANQL